MDRNRTAEAVCYGLSVMLVVDVLVFRLVGWWLG